MFGGFKTNIRECSRKFVEVPIAASMEAALEGCVRADRELATAIAPHVMVAGATGEVGRSLVAHLSVSGVKHITALVRNPNAGIAAELGRLKGVHLVKCSDVADQDALAAAIDTIVEQTGVPGALVSCMGISRSKIGRMDQDVLGNKVPAGEQYRVAATNLVREAERIGVQRFVYVSSGFVTRPRSWPALILNSIAGNVLGYHAVVEDIIRDKVSGSAAMDYVIVRPGGSTTAGLATGSKFHRVTRSPAVPSGAQGWLRCLRGHSMRHCSRGGPAHTPSPGASPLKLRARRPTMPRARSTARSLLSGGRVCWASSRWTPYGSRPRRPVPWRHIARHRRPAAVPSAWSASCCSSES